MRKRRARKATSRRGTPTPSPEWREFETLVARIEQCVSPTGAIVKSPDWIKSNVPGRKRQVDASVRAEVGSTSVLITIECRKRQPKEDVTWIEQLATKKHSLGAAHTIAVSQTGFSDSARATAELHGIHLRRLSDISPEDIRSWLPPQGLSHFYRHAGPLTAEIRFPLEPGDPPSTEVLPESRSDNAYAPVFVVPDGRLLSLNDMWLLAQAQQDLFVGIPFDGTPNRRTCTLRFSKGQVGIMTTAGRRYLTQMVLSADLSIKREDIPLNQAKIVEYAAPEGERSVYRIEFTTSAASRMNFRLGVQGIAGSDQAVMSVEPIPRPDEP
jgi:restriction endonuclease